MGQLSDRAEQQHSSQKGCPTQDPDREAYAAHPGVGWEQGGRGVGGGGASLLGGGCNGVSFWIGDFVSGVSAVPLGLSVGCQVLKGKYCFFFFSSPISVNFP